MQRALGDTLLDLVLLVLGTCWAMGWLVLLGLMGLQYLFPKRAARLEHALQVTGKILGPILKYAFWTACILFALRLVAGWLAWAPPIPAGDPGDYDPGG